MKTVKVLGSGCRNCTTTAQLIEEQAKALGVAVTIEKVTDLGQIMAYGVMRTPGVVVDGKVVHAGGVPRDPHAAPAILGPRAGLAQSGRHRSEMQRRLRNLPLSRWVCEGISQGTE